MVNEVSVIARFLSTGLAYSGIGYLYGKGRDLWRKAFRITDKTREKIQTLNDVDYTAVFNLAIFIQRFNRVKKIRENSKISIQTIFILLLFCPLFPIPQDTPLLLQLFAV